MCKTFPFFGSERGYGAIDKIRQLHADTNKSNKDIIAWFYSALTILDAKANGLLRVNSLLITVLAAFFGASRTAGNPLKITPEQTATAMLALFLVMASTIFCFLIVRISWKFLGHVQARTVPGQATAVYDFDSEAKRLANVVDNRTHYYWIGWLLTFAAVLLPPASLWLGLIPSFLVKLLS